MKSQKTHMGWFLNKTRVFASPAMGNRGFRWEERRSADVFVMFGAVLLGMFPIDVISHLVNTVYFLKCFNPKTRVDLQKRVPDLISTLKTSLLEKRSF